MSSLPPGGLRPLSLPPLTGRHRRLAIAGVVAILVGVVAVVAFAAHGSLAAISNDPRARIAS